MLGAEGVKALSRDGGRRVACHVLDDGERGYRHLLEELDALDDVDEGEALRRAHEHAAGHANTLRERELHVARARGQVDDEEVERPPRRLPDHLLDERRDLGAAQHHRMGVHPTYRHQTHAVALEREDGRTDHAHLGRLWRHHRRQRRPVDVHVHKPDARAERGERKREVDGGRRLADAALAAADRDDVRDLREAGRRLARLRGRGQQRALDRRQRNAKRIDERSLARGRERDDCGRLGRACAQREES
mmetsp:Transcript_7469/g.23583  ORF Transcript_7469/g.23583 Transcript_7469/m.23583 type:complete len:248 (+) Transcript_7469:1253-1996(+)